MAKKQIRAVTFEERISQTTQKIQGNLVTSTYPQKLFVSLFLHKRFLQFLV